jgi:hypothetical protein
VEHVIDKALGYHSGGLWWATNVVPKTLTKLTTSLVECNKLCRTNKPCRPTKTGADWTPQGRARLKNTGYPPKQLLASLIQLIQLNQLNQVYERTGH